MASTCYSFNLKQQPQTIDSMNSKKRKKHHNKENSDNEESDNENIRKKSKNHASKTVLSTEYLKQAQEKWNMDVVKLSTEIGRLASLIETLIQTIANLQQENKKSQEYLLKTIKHLFYDPRQDRWWEKKVYKAVNELLHKSKYPSDKELKDLVQVIIK